MSRKSIFAKANKEFKSLSGFDLMYKEDYIGCLIDLHKLISKNNQWLLDHVNDVERGMRAHLGEEVICFTPNVTVGYKVRALVRLLRHEDGPEYYWNTSCYGNHHIASAVTHWHREPAAPDSAGDHK